MCSCSSHIPCFHLVPAIPSCFWLLSSCCTNACLQPHMQINSFFTSSLPASAEPGSQLELPQHLSSTITLIQNIAYNLIFTWPAFKKIKSHWACISLFSLRPCHSLLYIKPQLHIYSVLGHIRLLAFDLFYPTDYKRCVLELGIVNSCIYRPARDCSINICCINLCFFKKHKLCRERYRNSFWPLCSQTL